MNLISSLFLFPRNMFYMRNCQQIKLLAINLSLDAISRSEQDITAKGQRKKLDIGNEPDSNATSVNRNNVRKIRNCIPE